jgi:hypothetical protein
MVMLDRSKHVLHDKVGGHAAKFIPRRAISGSAISTM